MDRTSHPELCSGSGSRAFSATMWSLGKVWSEIGRRATGIRSPKLLCLCWGGGGRQKGTSAGGWGQEWSVLGEGGAGGVSAGGWGTVEGVSAGSRLPFRTAEVVNGKKMPTCPSP